MAPDNTSLGQFNLDGLPPAPRGVPKIEVTFDIDADGILNVTAKDMASQKSQSIRITGSTRLPEAEKQRMIDQAQQYAEAGQEAARDGGKAEHRRFGLLPGRAHACRLRQQACRRSAPPCRDGAARGSRGGQQARRRGGVSRRRMR